MHFAMTSTERRMDGCQALDELTINWPREQTGINPFASEQFSLKKTWQHSNDGQRQKLENSKMQGDASCGPRRCLSRTGG